ncbi:MAG: hypothetical protein EA379_04240 [Phycisphaerales bacterium]|nr:MAG: hypothetical protein EA379_04240 [Phycisphaerales bacterium]
MPQDVKAHPQPETTERPSLQGLAVTREDEHALLDALEQAFDYRGDVTIETTDGRTIGGYIFDRVRGGSLGESSVRLMGAASDEKIRVRYDEIARVEFTGKDPAHGKSFDNWMKKFAEKRLKGERASIEAESLDAE